MWEWEPQDQAELTLRLAASIYPAPVASFLAVSLPMVRLPVSISDICRCGMPVKSESCFWVKPSLVRDPLRQTAVSVSPGKYFPKNSWWGWGHTCNYALRVDVGMGTCGDGDVHAIMRCVWLKQSWALKLLK